MEARGRKEYSETTVAGAARFSGMLAPRDSDGGLNRLEFATNLLMCFERTPILGV